MRFIDEVRVEVTAGRGGSGFVGWRRKKFVPEGGPDGGDGGNGGAVIFVVDTGLNTLLDFSFNPLIRAEDGEAGGTKQLTGADGADVVRPVPLGTQVYFNDKLVADLSVPNARWIAARGGSGGKGNAFFKSSKNQAPDFAQPGQDGQTFTFTLVLKSVADVGLLGLPNAGKSTLISKVSQATPRIADYPFTTLAPHLGVACVDSTRRLVIADIPGLIPGAHEGKGLGHQFLKHVERTAVLAQLIDVSLTVRDSGHADDYTDEELRTAALTQFESLDYELRQFSAALLDVPRLVVFSKADNEISRRAFTLCRDDFAAKGLSAVLISSVTGEGLTELLEQLYGLKSSKNP